MSYPLLSESVVVVVHATLQRMEKGTDTAVRQVHVLSVAFRIRCSLCSRHTTTDGERNGYCGAARAWSYPLLSESVVVFVLATLQRMEKGTDTAVRRVHVLSVAF